eukprot:scaffold134222_cov105-Phaeocystis_antarctica.AAC.1
MSPVQHSECTRTSAGRDESEKGASSPASSGALTSAMCSMPSTRLLKQCAMKRPCLVGIFAGRPHRSTSASLRRTCATTSAVVVKGMPASAASSLSASQPALFSSACSATCGSSPASLARSMAAS